MKTETENPPQTSPRTPAQVNAIEVCISVLNALAASPDTEAAAGAYQVREELRRMQKGARL